MSGSSGRLVVENRADAGTKPDYPGRVFEEHERDYVDVMLDFVNRSRAQDKHSLLPTPEIDEETASLKVKKQALRIEEAQLQDQQRQSREQRRQEDAIWKKQKAQHRSQIAEQANFLAVERKRQQETWQLIRTARRQQIAQRKLDDEQWRQQRLSWRMRWEQLPIVTSWIAILLVTDNCSRQCIGLPLFIAGAHVTSQMVVDALRTLLPPELRFLISDRGVHFTAQAFQDLVNDVEFVHVCIARHRPQSNGIAERFVRTIKEWLKDKSWSDPLALDTLLQIFLDEYNHRPHQGLAIPGLSPTEFANRIYLF